MHWQTICIHDGVNLGRQPASRSTYMLLGIARDAGSVLMHTDNGRIDHLHRRIMSCGQCLHNLVPDAGPFSLLSVPMKMVIRVRRIFFIAIRHSTQVGRTVVRIKQKSDCHIALGGKDRHPAQQRTHAVQQLCR